MRISELQAGMIPQEDARTESGLLIVVRGQAITDPLIVCLSNFHKQNAIADRVLVEYSSGEDSIHLVLHASA